MRLHFHIFFDEEEKGQMDTHPYPKDILNGQPTDGVVKKDSNKYITELDETKTRVVDRYRIGRQMGKVLTANFG